MLETEIKKALMTVKPFQYLEPGELEMLMSYCKLVTFTDGQTVFQQGKASEGMLAIISGSALVSVKTLGEEAMHLAVLERGDFVGEINLIEKGPCTASVYAKGELVCLLVTTTYFEMLGLSFPEIKFKISRALTETICTRLIDLHKKITDIMEKSDIATMSLFNNVLTSLIKPSKISMEDAHINLELLKTFTPFKLFTEEDLTELIKHTDFISAEKNCTLIKENEMTPCFFMVLRGAVSSNIVKDHKVAKLSILGPMAFFGSISYIDGLSSIITYRSCERVILLRLSTENLALLQKNNIALWYKIYDLICDSFVILERSADKLQIRLNSELYNV